MHGRSIAAVALGLALLGAWPAALSAQECSAKLVKARGGLGVIEATAKSRARSAWIKRVRYDRRLGPSYAAWLRAKDPEYHCRKVARRVACEAIAIPCKI